MKIVKIKKFICQKYVDLFIKNLLTLYFICTIFFIYLYFVVKRTKWPTLRKGSVVFVLFFVLLCIENYSVHHFEIFQLPTYLS